MDAFSIVAALIVVVSGLVAATLILSRRSLRLRSARDQWQAQATIAAEREQESRLEIAALTERLRRFAELEDQLAARNEELESSRRQIADIRADLARAQQALIGAEQQVTTMTRQIADRDARIAQSQNDVAALKANLAELAATSAAERQAAAEKLTLLTQAKDELGQQFSRIADEVLAKRTEQQEKNLSTLLDPVKTKLDEFRQRVDTVHKEGSDAAAAMRKEVEMYARQNQQIAEDTKNLTRALKGDNKAQGTWGEIVLERLLELSGLTRGRDYDSQVAATVTDDDGSVQKVQPDFIVYLPELPDRPGKRHLVIDAKVSLTAFERYQTTEDESERQIALKEHLASVRRHIAMLSVKDYEKLDFSSASESHSVGYVILFLAVEPAFLAAIRHDDALWQDAWKKNVMLVSPSTLLIALRMIDHLWRQDRQANNAKAIFEIAESLYAKFGTFYEHFEKIGGALDRAKTAYQDADNRLKIGRGNVYRQITKLTQQKLISSKVSLPSLGFDEADDDPVDSATEESLRPVSEDVNLAESSERLQ